MGRDNLPDAELEVLAVLWQRGESTARDVREAVESFRPMTHGAVFTLLRRLEQKTLVSRRKGKVGKAFVYKARIKPGSTYRKLIGDLLERVFGGSPVTLVSSLFETRPPSSGEIEELQELLDDLKKEARGATRRRRTS